MAEPAEDLDGRRQRAVRSREAVVDAMLDLLRETGEQPSAQTIADRAGVSLRTVFRLFDDIDTLLSTAVAHQIDRVGPMFGSLEVTGPLDRRIHALVVHRERLFEEIAPVRRAALHRTEHSLIREWLDESHGLLRGQLTALFADELQALPARQRKLLVESLNLATGFSAWNALQVEQGLDAATARAVVIHTITRLLEGR